MNTLFYNAYMITVNEQDEVFPQGYIVCKNGVIQEIGAGKPENRRQYDQTIDLQGKWLLPGWINTHGHAAMSLLRGYADDYPLQEWLKKKIWPMENHFNEDTVRWGTSLAVLEMLKSGTTTFNDMYDHMHVVAEVVQETGIRAVLSRGMIGLGPEEEQKQKLSEAVHFAREWHKQADGRITTMLAPHAPYTCPPAYLRQIMEQAQELDLPLHIHMSETAQEVRKNEEEYGKRPVAHLQGLGLFEQPTIVAHAVHVNEEEMEILYKHHVQISHNPTSNLKLGSGVAPLTQFLNKGFHVSIGTDSAASNNNLDMFQEVRQAALIHKGVQQDPTSIPAQTALTMGTRWGAESLFLAHTGSLQKGKKCDFITIDPKQAHLQPATDPVSHVIYAASGRDVADVYIDGKAIVQNGQCQTLDEEKVLFEANRAFDKLQK